MPMLRINPGVLAGPACSSLSNSALGLYLLLAGYASEHLTDGLITRNVWQRLFVGRDESSVDDLADLVEAGLVTVADGIGYQIDPDHGPAVPAPSRGEREWAAQQQREDPTVRRRAAIDRILTAPGRDAKAREYTQAVLDDGNFTVRVDGWPNPVPLAQVLGYVCNGTGELHPGQVTPC